MAPLEEITNDTTVRGVLANAAVKLIDAKRIGSNALRIVNEARIAEEVLGHLASLQGAKSEVTLDIEVHIPDGVPDNVVRTVTENCRTMKFESQGFEEE